MTVDYRIKKVEYKNKMQEKADDQNVNIVDYEIPNEGVMFYKYYAQENYIQFLLLIIALCVCCGCYLCSLGITGLVTGFGCWIFNKQKIKKIKDDIKDHQDNMC